MDTRTALVTGAAKRIGAAIARVLHAEGLNVVIHYHRSEREARELCASLNAIRRKSADLVCADLLDESSWSRIIEQARGCYGDFDVLVNNASAFYPTPMGTVTPDQWKEIVGTNLKAPFFLSQIAAPMLRQRRGCIVNLSDIHAERPLRHYAVYSVAKAGLVMLTRALAKELAPEVRVNAVAPGAAAWPPNMDAALKERILSHTALKRAGTPEEVAGAVRFLVMEAGYVTGQVLTVDGGRTLYS